MMIITPHKPMKPGIPLPAAANALALDDAEDARHDEILSTAWAHSRQSAISRPCAIYEYFHFHGKSARAATPPGAAEQI